MKLSLHDQQKGFLFTRTHRHTHIHTHTHADPVCRNATQGGLQLQKHCPLLHHSKPRRVHLNAREPRASAGILIREVFQRWEEPVCFVCVQDCFSSGMNVGCEGKAAELLCRGLGYVSLWFTSPTPAAVQPEFIKLHASSLILPLSLSSLLTPSPRP